MNGARNTVVMNGIEDDGIEATLRLLSQSKYKGQVMKGLLLIVAVMLTGLSGCYVVPYGTRDDGRGGERGNRDRYH